MVILYYSGNPSHEVPCVVRIEGDQILVEYNNGGLYQYNGVAKGEGHFELKAVGFDGRGTLHRFLNSSILEGGWIEEGIKGMWRIQLA